MSEKAHILLLESISAEALHLLKSHFQVHEQYLDQDITAEVTDQIAAIITRGKGQVTAELIAACTQLKAIARCGVGLDNIDVTFASNQQVMVLNLPGSNAHTVAEHAMSLMLNLQRQLVPVFTAVKQGDWQVRTRYGGDELRNKQLGIVGLGNIGGKVAQMAQAFGCRIRYHNTNPLPNCNFTYSSFKELIKESDILSLHLPLTEQTHHMFDYDVLSQLKPGALIINTSRGALIDEHALVQVLQEEILAGYATDVLTVEPPPQDHPLLQFPQVLVTPHLASLTSTTYHQMCMDTVTNVRAVLSGQTIDHKFIFNRDSL